MSRPYFIRLPKSVIKDKFDIEYKNGIYPYPKREEIIYLDQDKYTELTNQVNYKQMSANTIKTLVIDKILLEKYNASQTFESGGGKAGYTMNLYIDQENFDKVYFYTMNIYKRTKAKKDFQGEKYYYINIYSIPYRLFKMLMEQDTYEFLFWQKPSGFVFNIDLASARFHDWSFPLKNRKNINW